MFLPLLYVCYSRSQRRLRSYEPSKWSKFTATCNLLGFLHESSFFRDSQFLDSNQSKGGNYTGKAMVLKARVFLEIGIRFETFQLTLSEPKPSFPFDFFQIFTSENLNFFRGSTCLLSCLFCFVVQRPLVKN